MEHYCNDIFELLAHIKPLTTTGEIAVSADKPQKLCIGWQVGSDWYGIRIVAIKKSANYSSINGVNIDLMNEYFKTTHGRATITALLNNNYPDNSFSQLLDRLGKLRAFS